MIFISIPPLSWERSSLSMWEMFRPPTTRQSRISMQRDSSRKSSSMLLVQSSSFSIGKRTLRTLTISISGNSNEAAVRAGIILSTRFFIQLMNSGTSFPKQLHFPRTRAAELRAKSEFGSAMI